MSNRSLNNKLAMERAIRNKPRDQIKMELAVAINVSINEQRLSQAQAARLLGVPQPKISALANYRLDGLSVQRLFKLLNALGRDVVIQVGRRKEFRSKGKTLVNAI